MSLFLANYLKFDAFFHSNQYVVLQAVVSGLWALIFFSARLHSVNRENGILDHLNKLTTALVVNLAIIFALWFALKPFQLSRQHLFYTYFSFLILSVGWRLIWHIAIQQYRLRGYNLRNVVVIGMSETSTRLMNYFKENPGFGYRLMGYFDDHVGRGKTLGKVRDLKDFALGNNVDIIYAYLPSIPDSQLKDIINFAENNLIKIKIISQFSNLGYKNLSIQNHGNISVVNISAIQYYFRGNHPQSLVIIYFLLLA